MTRSLELSIDEVRQSREVKAQFVFLAIPRVLRGLLVLTVVVVEVVEFNATEDELVSDGLSQSSNVPVTEHGSMVLNLFLWDLCLTDAIWLDLLSQVLCKQIDFFRVEAVSLALSLHSDLSLGLVEFGQLALNQSQRLSQGIDL